MLAFTSTPQSYVVIGGVDHFIAPPSKYKVLLRSPSPGHDNHPSRGKHSQEGYQTTPVSKFEPAAGFDTIFEPARYSESHKTHALLEVGNQRPDIGRDSLLEAYEASLIEDVADGCYFGNVDIVTAIIESAHHHALNPN